LKDLSEIVHDRAEKGIKKSELNEKYGSEWLMKNGGELLG